MNSNPNKYKFIPESLTANEHLKETAFLLTVAIRRLVRREREQLSKNSLDFSFKWSVTAGDNKIRR